MKTCLQVALTALFSLVALVAYANGSGPAKPESSKMVELKTKIGAGYLVLKPAEIRGAIWLWPEPSQTFKPIPFKGAVKGEMRRVLSLKDGGVVLASSHGGYIISKDGDVKVVGPGKKCQAVAVSPTGEIAFGFSLRLPFILLTDVRRDGKEVFHTVLEIHTIGPKARTIVLGQQWFDGSLYEMAFSKDGMLAVASSEEGLTLIRDDKAWSDPKMPYYVPVGELEFNPKYGNEFLHANYRYRLNLKQEGSFTKNYAGSLYGNKGEIISIKKNREGSWCLYDGANESSLDGGVQPGYYGVGAMAVSEKFIVYASLDTVVVWARAEKKAVRQITQVPEGNLLDRCVNAIAFRPSGELIIATNNEVSEWNPETGKKLKVLLLTQ